MADGLGLLSREEVERFETSVLGGSTLDVVPTTFDTSRQPDSWWGPTWAGRAGSGSGAEQKRRDMQQTFGGTGRRLILMFGISEPGNEHNYRPGATGRLDSAWRNMAQNLVDMDMGDTIIRPNPEHSMPWSDRFPLSLNGKPAPQEFADAFARCVSVMNTVPGANFVFVYNPTGKRLELTLPAYPTNSNLWPAGESLPIMSPSFYDKVSSGGPTAGEWGAMNDTEKERSAKRVWNLFHKPYLEMYQSVASRLGAEMGIVEWGTTSANLQNVGRGDNPWFVEHAFDYFEANQFVMEAWWNYPSGTFKTGGSTIWPPSESNLRRSFLVWRDRVRAHDVGD